MALTNQDFLKNYYQNVYPLHCTPDNRFLASTSGFVYYSRLIEAVSLPVQILTFYCILKKSPESMRSVKSGLLSVNVWSILSGIVLSFIVTPYNFFPYYAGFTIGLAQSLNTSIVFQFYLGLAMTFGILISITILFENRSSLIARNRFGISRISTKIIWICTNFFGSMIVLTPVFLNLPEQTSAKIVILKELPCPSPEFFTEPILVLDDRGFWKTYLTVTLILIYLNLMAQILFFSVCCIYYLFIFKSSQVSAQTRQLQIRSFFGMLGQTLIPILFDSIPTVIFLDRQGRNEYDQFNNNLMGLSIVLHNGATNVSILLVQNPYRMFLKSVVFGGKKVEANVILNVSGDASRRV